MVTFDCVINHIMGLNFGGVVISPKLTAWHLRVTSDTHLTLMQIGFFCHHKYQETD